MLEFLTRTPFFRKFFYKKEDSKNIAKERLRMILIHDRASVSPAFLESLKSDLLAVFTRYMIIDEQAMDIMLDRQDGSVALAANIPIISIRRNPLPSPSPSHAPASPSKAARQKQSKETKATSQLNGSSPNKKRKNLGKRKRNR